VTSRRILILGAAGQVGRELQRSFAGCGEVQACTREQCDLANPAQIREVVRRFGPEVILNAAAYTAVDRAETERDLAIAINAIAPGILAEEAQQLGALLVHYSTDYVFDGAKDGPWQETDQPNPLNHYGATKLAGEQAIIQMNKTEGAPEPALSLPKGPSHLGTGEGPKKPKYLIFRTSWVYGPHGGNFLQTMLRLGRERDRLTVVADQTGAPTTSIAIAEATRTIVDGVLAGTYGTPENWTGLYHMTCTGSTTWFGFASEIFKQAERLQNLRAPQLTPITTDQWPTPAKRPRNSVLDNQKLRQKFGVELPNWQSELSRTLAQITTNH
jgi:dTDP-4-dehydrorhamnose reductase